MGILYTTLPNMFRDTKTNWSISVVLILQKLVLVLYYKVSNRDTRGIAVA